MSFNFRAKYLDVVICKRHQIALSKFRCSNHRLGVERLRGVIDRADRVCRYCLNLDIIRLEDEYHLFCICPLYNNIRNQYTMLGRLGHQNFESFIHVMTSTHVETTRQLASFVYHALKIHKEYNML